MVFYMNIKKGFISVSVLYQFIIIILDTKPVIIAPHRSDDKQIVKNKDSVSSDYNLLTMSSHCHSFVSGLNCAIEQNTRGAVKMKIN